jgi:Phage tail protein.
MSIMLNGAKYAIATVLAQAVPITGISNANPAVALADDTPTAGDILILSSGWGELDESPVKVGTVVADTSFQLLGYSTTDLVRFPNGEGVGGYVIASDFVNLPKIHDIQKSGGEQNYATRQYVSDPSGKQVQAPTFKSARNRTYMLDYQPDKPHFQALIELDRSQEITILRETLRNGDVIYYAGRASFDQDPTTALNEFISNAFSFSPTADSIRYPAA